MIVILSNAKNLAFPLCYEILHRACPELNYATLRFTQGDGEGFRMPTIIAELIRS
jgi:hypothetical protein